MTPHSDRVAVIVCKPAGRVLFTHCANHAAAESMVNALVGLGQRAEIDSRPDLPMRPGSIVPDLPFPAEGLQ